MTKGSYPSIRASFEAYEKQERQSIKQLYRGYAQTSIPDDEKADSNAVNEFLLAIEDIFDQRDLLPMLCTYHKDQLEQINPASFTYLTEIQRARLKKQLFSMFYVFFAQYQLAAAEQEKKDLEEYKATLDLCVQYLKRWEQHMIDLDAAPACGEKASYDEQLQAEINWANKCLKFIGLDIGAWFTQFRNNPSEALLDWMNALNERRLYWVWGGGMLEVIFDALPDEFFNKLEAQINITRPAPITGYTSWVLYYARFSIHALLAVKHKYVPSPDEANIDEWKRFIAQLDQRKFSLINDLIWGFANMLCFFWLKGNGMLGYMGNVSTAGLLIMDLIVATWDFIEGCTKHNADMGVIQKDRKELTAKIVVIEHSLDDALSAENKQKLKDINKLKAALKDLNKKETKANFEWKYRKSELINNWIYALSLLFAFCLMCCFLIPPAAVAPATTLILGIVGAALCYLLTLIKTAVDGDLKRSQSLETSQLKREHCETLLQKFKEASDPNNKILLYLSMKQEMAISDYQQKMAHFQMISLIRSVLIDALIPVIVFSSLIFMSTGIGLGVMAASFAVGIISRGVIDHYFQPLAGKPPEFNQDQYDRFEERPSLSFFERRPGMFNAPPSPKPAEDDKHSADYKDGAFACSIL